MMRAEFHGLDCEIDSSSQTTRLSLSYFDKKAEFIISNEDFCILVDLITSYSKSYLKEYRK